MMVQLARNRILDGILRGKDPHPGLLLSRGWPQFTKGTEDDLPQAPHKATHVARVCAQPPSAFYRLAYDRWVASTSNATGRFATHSAMLVSRLFIGLTAESAVETGVTTSHTYGMPYIPGSSIKGAVNAYARSIEVPAPYRSVLFGTDDDDANAAGVTPGSASLVWHDAWWVPPAQGGAPFEAEVVTVHHKDYYGGGGAATDFDDPVPNAQIAVAGSFYFCVEGDRAWAQLALDLLKRAIVECGIGAKVAAGYGLFRGDDREFAPRRRRVQLSTGAGAQPSSRPERSTWSKAKLVLSPGTATVVAHFQEQGQMKRTVPVKFADLQTTYPEHPAIGRLKQRKEWTGAVAVEGTGNMVVLIALLPEGG